MVSKLLIGSGGWHWPEYVGIDANAGNEPDIIAIVPPLPPEVMAQRWTEIMMIHAIEHIAPWKALELAKQCYECLADGGVFILEQPNIIYAAKVLLGIITPPDGEPGQYDMWPLYGNPETEDEWMLHKWGWTPLTLTNMLIEAGFKKEKIIPAYPQFHGSRERDFRLEAVK